MRMRRRRGRKGVEGGEGREEEEAAAATAAEATALPEPTSRAITKQQKTASTRETALLVRMMAGHGKRRGNDKILKLELPFYPTTPLLGKSKGTASGILAWQEGSTGKDTCFCEPDLSLILGTHVNKDKRRQMCTPTSTHALWHTCIHTHTHPTSIQTYRYKIDR